MKMLIWEYNNKFYLTLKFNVAKDKEVADMLRKDALQVENGFTKGVPYTMDLINIYKLRF